MDIDDYVKHIANKYRFAITIAVLKEKPPDVSIENFIQDIKNKLNDQTKELDITVCSDDFDFDDGLHNDNDFHDNDRFNETETTICSESILKNYDMNVFNGENINIGNRSDFNHKILDKDTSPQCSDINNELNQRLTQDLDATFCPTLNNGQEQYLTNFNSDKDINTTPIEQINGKPNDFNLNKTDNETKASKDLSNINKAILNDQINDEANELYINLNETDTQATILYSVHGYTQQYDCTHVSQSQYNQIVLPENLLKRKPRIIHSNENLLLNNENYDTTKTITYEININNKQENVIENKLNTFINLNKNNKSNETVKENNDDDEVNETPILNENIDEQMNVDSVDMYTQNENTFINEINDITEETTETEELIPFKVIEEMNKVKCYLNRGSDRRIISDGSIESGYRSDSQSRSSYKNSLQLSMGWLNQSAHCLFVYIVQSRTIANTEKIAEEIAKVLGQLIDRLHEEETYPSFLDELLDNVEFLIQGIIGGDNSEDNILLKKDEDIHKLFLLNKSVHIQKYTIEKLTDRLQDVQKHLSNKELTFEMHNVDSTENLCYIFHVLEKILERYMKYKIGSSQMSQKNSQNEFPKRSAITQMWRKKWNPELPQNDNPTKTCVLVKCNAVLNDIVVSCMEGYSLVAFSALQCFNILQS